MDDRGLVGLIVGIFLGLVALLAIVAGVLYANDYKLRATVTDTDCEGSSPSVDVKTQLFGIEHTVKVPEDHCEAMHKGNFVEYHIRSQRTTIYAVEGGDCLYDSKTGPRCGESSGFP